MIDEGVRVVYGVSTPYYSVGGFDFELPWAAPSEKAGLSHLYTVLRFERHGGERSSGGFRNETVGKPFQITQHFQQLTGVVTLDQVMGCSQRVGALHVVRMVAAAEDNDGQFGKPGLAPQPG